MPFPSKEVRQERQDMKAYAKELRDAAPDASWVEELPDKKAVRVHVSPARPARCDCCMCGCARARVRDGGRCVVGGRATRCRVPHTVLIAFGAC